MSDAFMAPEGPMLGGVVRFSTVPTGQNLTQIATKYGCDKADHGFTEVYTRMLPKEDIKSLLELGVDKGASLLMWNEWFGGRVPIVGLDLKEYPAGAFGSSVRTYPTDCGSREALNRRLMEVGPGFDLIVDDASHWQEHMQGTLGFLWQCVNHGGYYVVEDLHVCIHPSNGGNPAEWYGSHMANDGSNSTLALLEDWVSGNWRESPYHLSGETTRIQEQSEWIRVFRPRGDDRHITCIIKKK